MYIEWWDSRRHFWALKRLRPVRWKFMSSRSYKDMAKREVLSVTSHFNDAVQTTELTWLWSSKYLVQFLNTTPLYNCSQSFLHFRLFSTVRHAMNHGYNVSWGNQQHIVTTRKLYSLLSRRLSMLKFSRAISRVKWLSGDKTNVSKTISVLVFRVLVWLL
jgi:hypothetical protein